MIQQKTSEISVNRAFSNRKYNQDCGQTRKTFHLFISHLNSDKKQAKKPYFSSHSDVDYTNHLLLVIGLNKFHMVFKQNRFHFFICEIKFDKKKTCNNCMHILHFINVFTCNIYFFLIQQCSCFYFRHVYT
jgi:hypothetical protein